MNALLNSLKLILSAFFVILVGTFSGCGGGGGGGTVSSPNPTIVNGVASNGPLNGSVVCAYAISNGVAGTTPIGTCSTTDSAGKYSINLGTYSGPVLFVAVGGTYVDEATGTTVNLTSPLHGMLSYVTGGSVSVAVTTLTELAYQNANALSGGLTSTNILSAIANVENNFGVPDIVNIMPVDALNVPTGATVAQKAYTLALATVSQYLNGLPTGTTLAAALQTMQACLAAPTTACGTGATSVATLLNTAMTAFKTSHSAFSGMTLPLANFGSINASNGSIVFQTIKQLPAVTVGQSPLYSQSVFSTPPSPPATYTYSIDTLANGVTPSGMTLNMQGILSGTPFATGAADINGFQIDHTYTFGVCATDTLSLTVTTPCPQTSITVLPLNITVTMAGTGSGTVTPSPAGNSCGVDCYSGFSSGSSVTLTATPATGSIFTGWSACVGAGLCMVPMNTSQKVTATFVAQQAIAGSFSGSGPVANTLDSCTFQVSLSGNTSITLSQTSGTVQGTALVSGNWSNTVTGGNCFATAAPFNYTLPVSGTTTNLTFSGGSFPAMNFTGVLNGSTITGTATFTFSNTTGTISSPMTLQ